jgi:peptidyl-prolyl cis-trans isomerase B (cyclophilin B)
MITLHTNKGDIKLELDHEKAPKTAANFEQYAKEGFYDGTIFPRVISNFMVQGGGLTADMRPKATRGPIKNEADHGISNRTGTLAMARTADPHSAGSQFFINVADNTFLDFKAPTQDGWGYCVFGRVTAGMDTVRNMEAAPTGSRAGHADVPLEPLVLERAEIIDD